MSISKEISTIEVRRRIEKEEKKVNRYTWSFFTVVIAWYLQQLLPKEFPMYEPSGDNVIATHDRVQQVVYPSFDRISI